MNTTYLYLLVFAILVGSTDIEVNIVSLYPPLGSTTVPTLFGIIALSYGVIVSILLGLAGMKALLIALFYQHLKYEPRALSSWVLIGLVIASLLMSLVFIQLHVH
jgi:cytochrome c oxidase subunit 4